MSIKRKDPIKEAGKFALRMAIFLLPVIVAKLTDSGLTEWASLLSAVIAVADKYIHVSPDIKATGLLPF